MSAEPLDIDAIEARANAATPAERLTAMRYGHGGGRMFVEGPILRKLIIDAYHEPEREFYFAARTDVPALIAEVRALRVYEARYEWALDNWGEFADLCQRTHRGRLDEVLDAAREAAR